jgi:hypothetical protein
VVVGSGSHAFYKVRINPIMSIQPDSQAAPDSLVSTPARSLVIYHFFEKDLNYVKNLAHFLLFACTDESDYLIVIAGAHTIELPHRSNVRYLFAENRNSDYGGYCQAMQLYGHEILTYDFIFFVNSSVRGPFLPTICDLNWQEIYRSKLVDDVGLVGTTINILQLGSIHAENYSKKYGGTEPYSHVQSMAYAMPRHTLAFLVEQGFYVDNERRSKVAIIEDYELRLSQLILANGWNIASLLPEYANIDFRKPHYNINPTATSGDLNVPMNYFGRTPHPFEVVFTKTNRNMFTDAYLDRLAYSALCHHRPTLQWDNDMLLGQHVSMIEAVSRSADAVPLANSDTMTTDQILYWVELMLEQVPQTRPKVDDMLRRHEMKP